MLNYRGLLIAFMGLLVASPSHAATIDIDFSFTDTIGNVTGTVTGVIEGLAYNGYSEATDVIIESAPTALGLTTPLDVLISTGTIIRANDFYLSNGTVTSGTLAITANYGSAPLYPLNWEFCLAISVSGYCGAATGAYLENGGGDSVATDVAPTLTPVSSTPLPAALPMFAGGLGLVGMFARRKKRKAQGALTAA